MIASGRVAAAADEPAPRVGRADVAAGAVWGLVCVAAIARFGVTADGALAVGFASVLVALAVIDARTRRLPNRIVLPSTAVAFGAQGLFHPEALLEVALAGAGAALFFFAAALLTKGGVGMGDVKLVLLIGVVLGRDVVPAVVIGTSFGALAAVAILLRHGTAARRSTMAYGPYLTAGALIVLLTDVGSRL